MEIEDRANPLPRQFVLLKHVMPALVSRPTHWDLMIDFGEKLLTFEMRELPESLAPGVSHDFAVTRLTDHRRVYLDYEGPLETDDSGKDRGSVERVAAGIAQRVPCDSTTRVRYQLTADDLSAELEFRPCAVGEQTQLTAFKWLWHSNSG